MIPLYAYSPSQQTSVRQLHDLDGSQQLDLIEAFSALEVDSFLITAPQLETIQKQLAAPQPDGTIWGLDPSDATLVNLGVHETPDPTQLWLEVRPPFTFSHEQAVRLFGQAEPISP